jgi:hypothetical protein
MDMNASFLYEEFPQVDLVTRAPVHVFSVAGQGSAGLLAAPA